VRAVFGDGLLPPRSLLRYFRPALVFPLVVPY